MTEAGSTAAPGAAFREGFVEADGFRIRYMAGGPEGTGSKPLVHLHGAGGLRLSRASDLLAQDRRVIEFEMPGFGASAENTSSQTMPEMAATMAAALDGLRLDRIDLWGTSFGGKAAVCLAAAFPERVEALVLEAPAAIRPPGGAPPQGTPAEMARALYGHPERMPPMPAPDPAIAAKQRALVMRLLGGGSDAETEALMRQIASPTLVLFGTLDRVIPPEMGRVYKERIKRCYLTLVYDAGHLIGAERPEAFCEVVGDFLERHEAFLISNTETLIHP